VSFSTYAVTSWICTLPATTAYAFAGGVLSNGVDVGRTATWLGLGGTLIVLLSLLPRWLARRSTALADLLEAR
jgi:uncharacterized membrane protein YdjX (TVP38/TMEM64 family)